MLADFYIPRLSIWRCKDEIKITILTLKSDSTEIDGSKNNV